MTSNISGDGLNGKGAGDDPNRLIEEKSPYLLQHAYNPVDWLPWEEKAFARAKEEDKPIFLSIGYSTCHWCHVMEEESFTSESVARVLNNNYISIKVDREERPDIDKFYMEVCQAMTGRGGWPLTIIMTPDKKPFFARTYLPRNNLIQILETIKGHWHNNRGELINRSENILNSLHTAAEKEADRGVQAKSVGNKQLKKLINSGAASLQKTYDERFGGFSSAPKFPQPHTLMFLLRYYKSSEDERFLKMAVNTLEMMSKGGIYDQIGFGFSRYATDRRWLIPHFEKMLYDNAMLAFVYLEAYQVTGREDFARVAREVLTYLERDMRSEAGGFFSAEDADVEGEEGKFYLWKKEEIISILGDSRGEEFCRQFNISETGNFDGKNIPNLVGNNGEESLTRDEIWQEWSEEIEQLFQVREQRQRPFKDDKILTAWNGLAIAAFARAARIFADEHYREIAAAAIDFIEDNLTDENGELLRRYRDGEAFYRAYARDYAYLIWGLIEMYEASFNPRYLRLAVEHNNTLIEQYWDQEKGGLFQTSGHDNELPVNKKDTQDGAQPSANSIAALNWFRLTELTSDEELRDQLVQLLDYIYYRAEGRAQGFTGFLAAAVSKTAGGQELTITGENFPRQIHTAFLPFTSLLQVSENNRKELAAINEIAAAREQKKQQESGWTAYLCEKGVCHRAITELEELKNSLNI